MKIYRAKSYSQDEVSKSLKHLNDQLSLLLEQRSQVTKDINKVRKDIEFWEGLDERQLKMFQYED